ncbi:MAG TPA: SagB/ThcOx family dehydrogenase [Elusimicrobiales bacterium]|nr:SagB/ThcOx family dehydrogenase [Elusimicrobiales bacterium]
MKKILAFFVMLIFCVAGANMLSSKKKTDGNLINLPKPSYSGKTSIEQALLQRRSVRSYANKPLTLKEISQLLWATQGITNKSGFRTAPSAGANYPLELYAIIQNADGVSRGIYKYIPQGHKLKKVRETDKIDFENMSLQSWISKSPVIFAITAIYERITKRYGERAAKYVHMEAGHAAQNLQLQGISLNIGSCVVGAFSDDEISKMLGLSKTEKPLYLIPTGKKS